jgi:hypothetical protein
MFPPYGELLAKGVSMTIIMPSSIGVMAGVAAGGTPEMASTRHNQVLGITSLMPSSA